jgi:crotonobetainyl-CoA hydratase
MMINVEKYQGIVEVTLTNPKVNAIGVAMSRELGRVFSEFMANDADQVAILSGGTGAVFSAGWDMKAAVAADEGEASDFGPGGFAGLTELFALTKPVIAAVNGIAIGGGVELMLACDLIVAAQTASFQLPETALGVLADAGGIQRLPRRLPYHIAMELMLTGRAMKADEAARYGLVNWVVPKEQVMDEARRVAVELAARAPLAVRAVKETVQGTLHLSEQEAFARLKRRELPTYQRMLNSADRQEGPRAFVEKRKPQWTGR